MAGLYEKLGINYAVFKRGAHVDWQTNLRPWSDEEKAQYFLKISEFYNTFTSKVAKGRGLTQERVDELGRGHVYTGERAIGLKLVTKQGGLADAIAFAQEKANLKEEPEISFAPKESSSLLTSLLGGILKVKTQDSIQATLPPMVLEALQGAFPSFLYLDPDVPWALMTEMIEIR